MSRQIGLAVRFGPRPLRRNVLHQRTALVHVQDLAAIADRQHRFMRRQGILEQSAIRPVAIGVERYRLGVASFAVTRRVHVRRTARKHEPIELRGLLSELSLVRAERDVYRVAARAPHGSEVMVEFADVPPALLITSAPGNADPGLLLDSRDHRRRKIVALARRNQQPSRSETRKLFVFNYLATPEAWTGRQNSSR